MLWKAFLVVFAAIPSVVATAAELSVIAPADARTNVDKEVIVEFTVMSARLIDDKKISFLNSERDNRDDKNFTAFVTPKGMRAFLDERKMENPAATFLDKKIRVKGKIEMHKSKPEIKVDRPDQIEVVKQDAATE